MKPLLLMAVLALVFWATPAFSQGCVMCTTSTRASGVKAQKALRRGIYIMLIPPFMMGLLLAGVCYKLRHGPGLPEDDLLEAPPQPADRS